MAEPAVVIVSNRGPLSFRRGEGGELVARRGAGGLVSGLAPLVIGTSTTWIAAALSEGDREAATGGLIETEGFRVRTLSLDPDDHRAAYETISNATLWFAYHGLFDLAREPVIDTAWREAWAAYRRTNAAFARAVAEEAPAGAVVLVQDLHLTLVAGTLAEVRPDLRCVHFTHTPFCRADGLRVLPTNVRLELLEGMAAHRACGFHSRRWADAFEECCRVDLGRSPNTFVAPLGPDADDLAAVVGSPASQEAHSEIDAALGGRQFVVRVDRIELSKNLLRGFQAFDDLLQRYPQWRERVVFGAYVYPSREGLEAYRRYRKDTEAIVGDVNRRWSTARWTPVLLDSTDDFPRSLAAMRRADVLLVNPISDGLNLVAMEGVLANDRNGSVVLSTGAGGWDLLGRPDAAFGVNPFDVSATADQLHRALSATPDERARRATTLHRAVSARTPSHWLADLLAAAGPPVSGASPKLGSGDGM